MYGVSKYCKKSIHLLLCGLILIVVPVSILAASADKIIYNVRRGDSIMGIARKFNIQVNEIIKWNNLSDPNNIWVGQKLKILQFKEKPDSRHYGISSEDASQLRLSKPVSNWNVIVGYRPYGDEKNLGLLCHVTEDKTITPASIGVIAKVGFLRGYGNYILIDHGKGWHTMYSNLNKINVTQGQKVKTTDNLGTVDQGRLFFLLSYRGKPVNPTGYFK